MITETVMLFALAAANPVATVEFPYSTDTIYVLHTGEVVTAVESYNGAPRDIFYSPDLATAFEMSGLVPCLAEDDVNCYWDATTQGNGEGTSFLNLRGEVSQW